MREIHYFRDLTWNKQYCGFINIRGHKFLWFSENLSLKDISNDPINKICTILRYGTSMNIKFVDQIDKKIHLKWYSTNNIDETTVEKMYRCINS